MLHFRSWVLAALGKLRVQVYLSLQVGVFPQEWCAARNNALPGRVRM